MKEQSADRTAPMAESTVLGQAEHNSPAGQKRRDTHKLACDAKAKADIAGLFAAYRQSVEERAEFEEMWIKTACVLTDKDRRPRLEPVEAMRDVAIAAIDLARDVAMGDRNAS